MDNLVHVQWRKSSRSSGNAACVEVADLDGGARAVRDSKDPAGGHLTFTATDRPAAPPVASCGRWRGRSLRGLADEHWAPWIVKPRSSC
jgi:hypothetical protein